jgi:hypothetical protein
MKKVLLQFLVIFLFFSSQLHAEDEDKQFPNVSGNVLFQGSADRIISSQQSGVSPNNAYVYIESNLALNFNKNWSIKTDWRMQPSNVMTTRDPNYPERYRTFFQQTGRGINAHDESLLVEELKLDFKNEDMNFFFGKFDPTFGTAYRKGKRMGVFTSQFAEDYNLREKLGAGISAFLENSKITINTFYNDTTGLSRSALSNRSRAPSSNGIAGNTGTLSSYSVSMEGENLFNIENLFYNVGYRSLGVASVQNRARETGYVVGSEYVYKITEATSLIPFVEVVRISNFTGERGRDAVYSTFALMTKYSSWIASVSRLDRNIKSGQSGTPRVGDNQLQLSVGYKFNDNLTLDFTRANIKESGRNGVMLGAVLSYIYKF